MKRTLPLILAFAFALSACSSGTPDEGGLNNEADGQPWTILAYSIADTDLEPFMVQDVNEMGVVGSSESLNIIALVDRAADYGNNSLLDLGGYVGGKLMQVNQGSADVLEDLGNINTGDPQVLADFISYGIENYPAGHYALIISDHGASWPGVGGDESSNHDALSLAELDEAIGAGLEGSGVDKLDLLGFDACLMATYEVASTLAPHAHRLLSSQELEPGHGWNYEALQVVNDEPGATVDTLGSALIDGFEQQAVESGTQASITLSLIDLNKMAALDTAMANFSSQLAERTETTAPAIGRTRSKVLGFGRSPNPQEDTQMADLGLLVSEIGVEALDVADAADAVTRSLADSLVDSVEGQATKGATGLAIYFPPNADLYNRGYDEIATDGDWHSFLDAYYAEGADIPLEAQAKFLDEDGEAEVFFDEDGLNIAGEFDIAGEDNLADAVISYGVIEDGEVIFIGEEPAAIADDESGIALGIYDLTALTISDGEDTAYAYLSLDLAEDDEVATISVPMAYYAPNDVDGETYKDVLLELTLEVESADILNETYYAYDPENQTYGELFAKPRGIIVPEVLIVDEDGNEFWEPTTDVGLYANLPDIQYDLEDLEPGTELFVMLTVTDFGGNSDSVSAMVTVPRGKNRANGARGG